MLHIKMITVHLDSTLTMKMVSSHTHTSWNGYLCLHSRGKIDQKASMTETLPNKGVQNLDTLARNYAVNIQFNMNFTFFFFTLFHYIRKILRCFLLPFSGRCMRNLRTCFLFQFLICNLVPFMRS